VSSTFARSIPEEQDRAEERRLSVFDLVGLAVGGVIGSGWLFAAAEASRTAGFGAIWAWAIGGAVMIVIAVVMVELSAFAPKTGGLIFLPLQSSGPLVAIIAAASLWVFYATNPASEAAAMTKGLAYWYPNLLDSSTDTPTMFGFVTAASFMAVIFAINLVAQRLFVKVNFALTLWKVLVPVLIVVLLLMAGFDGRALTEQTGREGNGLDAALAAVVGGGVIYAYTGFQAPLDLAGNVRRRGVGEAARLRWAVYGTLAGSIILYIALQVVFLGHNHGQLLRVNFDSPYTQFAIAASFAWLAPLIRIDALLSPMGSGLVFTNALTREVAALSRAHLTHRGLQTARHASIKLGNRTHDVYWLVLLANFVVSLILLLVTSGSWKTLITIISVATLVVYALPGVVLVSLRRGAPGHPQVGSNRRGHVQEVLAHASFVSIALLLYWARWASLWRGLLVIAIGCVLLFGLPLLARRDVPVIGRLLRKYDTKEHVTLFRQWRTNPAARAATLLLGYLGGLAVLTLLGKSTVGVDCEPWLSLLVAGFAFVTFRRLVAMSMSHMAEVPPTLPIPARATSG